MKVIILIILFGLVLLSGCVTTRNFSIEIEGVNQLTYPEAVEVTGHDFDWVEKYSGGHYFNVNVSIDKSFIKYNQENIGNVSAIYHFCDSPGRDLFLGFSRPYSHGTDAIFLVWNNELEKLIVSDRAYFNLVIFGSWGLDRSNDAPAFHRKDFRQYDLLGNPQDICFYIRSADMIYGVDSETVVIPKELFVDKIEGAQLYKKRSVMFSKDGE